MPTLIYHMTDINNLDSILKSGGLISHNEMNKLDVSYTDASYTDIQVRRATTLVPCCQGGFLHDYVPFFFAPRSPMLYVIHIGNVTNCPHGQNSIIHLVTSAESVNRSNLPFAFTDGHGIMSLSCFFDDLADLSQVDWVLMNSRMWRDTQDDNDRKRRRQAEFLVHEKMPFELIEKIIVFSNSVSLKVNKILADNGIKIPVIIDKACYY